MSLTRYATMDPYILLSAVNMQLRDDYADLTDLCKAHEIDEAALCKRLEDAGFTYDAAHKQFK
ncbi:MAG: DUF4250 domain-containing protein [Candidatus Anaerobiospirillum merdipullorum]|uniref:DUF4250 domain-containing protein n=1 Tax=Candidatus Anaerobiospirillum merdipullorum TaxID=2838450 RepID=A0A9E2KN05_9GAMM|nr:DUF4250 domain-containing protein [Candidatus Anaerobiospirillum merdipullorum]